MNLNLFPVIIRRIQSFLFHARTHGLKSAFHRVGQFLKYKIIAVSRKIKTTHYRDMSWDEFESRFLSRRDLYKGVFVQNSPIVWNAPLFQRPQQMALALGRIGYLVIYKTPNSVFDKVSGVRNIAPNVYLTSGENFDFIKGAVHSVYSTDNRYSNRHSLNLTEKGKPSFFMIYEYIDHIDIKISGKESIHLLTASKKLAFDGNIYNFIIATALRLADEARRSVGCEKVLYVANGVDTWHYRNPYNRHISLPKNMIKFRNKYENIIGYFGAIAPWLWYDELTKLINNRRDLGFIFIGPDYGNSVCKLPQADNMLWLDEVEYEILPAYANQFNVCFIPFEPGEIARTTSPIKLFEYFALEKPVVVTSHMYECTAFDVVFSGDDADSLSMAIDRAIDLKSDRAFKHKMARLADENSWDNRARSLEKIFPKTSRSFMYGRPR